MKITKGQYPNLVNLMKSVYPDYKGRKFFVELQSGEFDATSYWCEGSRTYFKFVRCDGKVFSLPDTSPWKQQEENRNATLVPGLACVTYTIFCGHDLGLTIKLHPNDFPKNIEYKSNK